MAVSLTIVGVVLSILGVITLGFATVLFQMPGFPYPRIQTIVYAFLRRGRRLQTAKESVRDGHVHYRSDPDVLETITPILREEFDIQNEELNELKYTHNGIEINHRGNRSSVRTGIDSPRESIAQPIENKQILYFKKWGGRVLIIGTILSIVGVIITFVF